MEAYSSAGPSRPEHPSKIQPTFGEIGYILEQGEYEGEEGFWVEDEERLEGFMSTNDEETFWVLEENDGRNFRFKKRLDHGWSESRTSQTRSAQRCIPTRSICEASARQHQARCSAQTGRCSTQVALCKLLCASCSAQVAPASWSLQVAPCKLRSLQVALRKLLCVSCSAQVALGKALCANWSVQVGLRKLLCATCSAQVALRKLL